MSTLLEFVDKGSICHDIIPCKVSGMENAIKFVGKKSVVYVVCYHDGTFYVTTKLKQ